MPDHREVIETLVAERDAALGEVARLAVIVTALGNGIQSDEFGNFCVVCGSQADYGNLHSSDCPMDAYLNAALTPQRDPATSDDDRQRDTSFENGDRVGGEGK